MTAPKALRVRACAKVNLMLRVGASGPDGYHAIETVFQSLALHDTIVCAPARGPLALTCDDPAVPVDSRNLVWKAARLLWQALGRSGDPAGCAVAIGKRIPVQAGLGGGSADAAAALIALHAIWKGRLTAPDLEAVAARVGADVPYFLTGGTALGLGRGDEIYPLEDVGPRWVVLACPVFGVATADAYRWFDEDAAAGRAAGAEVGRLAAWKSRALEVRNDLQGPVGRRHGEIGRLAGLLRRAGAEAAAMSGSGSTVFGVFGAEGPARRAAHAAAAAGTPSILTRTVNRAWCRRAFGAG